MKKSIAIRISIIFFMILFCTVLSSTISYIFHRSDSIDANARRALDIARSVSAIVDGDEMERIM